MDFRGTGSTTLSRVLLRPAFWYVFAAAIVVALFALGFRRAEDNSRLSQTRRALLQSDSQSRALGAQLADSGHTLKSVRTKSDLLADSLRRVEEALDAALRSQALLAADLANSRVELEHSESRIAQSEGILASNAQALRMTRQELAELRAATELPRPFGQGNGLVSIWLNCRCRDATIQVDGIRREARPGPVGDVDRACGDTRAYRLVVRAGSRHVVVAGRNGFRMEKYVTVQEGQCTFVEVRDP